MADAITIKALQDASLDAKSLEEVVNGDEAKQVTTRKGETYPSVKKAIKTLFENGGLPATPFATKALMAASALADGDYAMVTENTANNGLYVKTEGAWKLSKYNDNVLSKVGNEAILSDNGRVATLSELNLSGYGVDVSEPSFIRRVYYDGTTGEGVFHGTILSTPIFTMQAGDQLEYSTYVSSTASGNGSVIIIFNMDEEFIESYLGMGGNAGQSLSGTLTAIKDCKVAVSYFKEDGEDFEPRARLLRKKTYVKEEYLNSLIEGTFTLIAPTDISGYYNVSGVLLDNPNFVSTGKIPVLAGYTYRIKTVSGTSAGLAYVVFDSAGDLIEGFYLGGDYPNILVDELYTPRVDGFIAISHDTRPTTDLDAPGLYQEDTDSLRLLTNKRYLGKITHPIATPVNIMNNKCVIENSKSLIISGASFTSMNNQWFEWMCESLGVTGINKAVGGQGIGDLAGMLHDGSFYTQDTLNSTDALIIMQVWDFNILAEKTVVVGDVTYTDAEVSGWTAEDYDNSGWSALTTKHNKSATNDNEVAALFDYCMKKLQAVFYAERLNPLSDYFETQWGKPFNVVLTTHWNDARVKYNTSVREFSALWGCTLIRFDENIGFSKDMLHSNGSQHSLIYSRDATTIDGQLYGFHFVAGRGNPIVKRLAGVAKDCFAIL